MASGDTLVIFTPQCNEPPSADFATLDTRNEHPVLDFSAATPNESAVFSGVMPRNYSGANLDVYVHIALSTSASPTETVDLDVSFERIGDRQQDLDNDGFAGVQSVDNTPCPSTCGLVTIANVQFTNAEADSIAVGEGYRIKVTRDAANDDATGDAELRFVEIKDT